MGTDGCFHAVEYRENAEAFYAVGAICMYAQSLGHD